MASTEAPKRYPTRKRAEVSYKTVDKYEELGDDVENEPNVKNDPDDEVDWRTSKMKVSPITSSLQSVNEHSVELTIVSSVRLANPKPAKNSPPRLRSATFSPFCEQLVAIFPYL